MGALRRRELLHTGPPMRPGIVDSACVRP